MIGYIYQMFEKFEIITTTSEFNCYSTNDESIFESVSSRVLQMLVQCNVKFVCLLAT